jgi:hypothetical protein
MRKIVLILLALALALPASAQKLNIDFPQSLADRAREVVDVTLDASMLKLAAKFLGNDDADERAARDVVRGLEGIYVRSYEFDKEGEYDRSVLDRVRSQLGGSWKKIVNVRSRDRENSEIYVDMRGEKPYGMLILTAEPRELTVVNIVGPIDVDKLSILEGNFGVPHLAHKSGKDKQKEKDRE